MKFWKRYYYSYLDSFINFLRPGEGQTCLVISDVLGRVNDISLFLLEAKSKLDSHGRLIITQYNALWEPILRLASWLGWRKGPVEQNWLAFADLKNFAYLAGLEVIRSGTKMPVPVYIPIVSPLFNRFLANLWPFSRLGLFHFLVLRKIDDASRRQSLSLSIIVPARNEAATIEKIVQELPVLGSFTEIIFVEGNSVDHTFAEIVRVAEKYEATKKIKYVQQDRKGKGDAVRKGFDLASGDILTIYDADMTVPPQEIKKFYQAIVENKADFINGSRLIYPMEKESMRVLNFLGNKFFSLAFTWILGQPIKDTLCGTKMLWRKDYENIKKTRSFFGDFDPFGDFDLLFGAAKLNLKIIDLPVHYRERVHGTTNISRWTHGWLLLGMTWFAMRKLKFR